MGVDKQMLLKLLEDAILLENHSVPIYSHHLKTALFWSGLPAPERENLRIQLGILEKESMKHSGILVKLKKKIEESEKNVF